MNEWLVAATILIVALAACGAVCFFADPLHGLVALELAGTVATAVLLLLSVGFHRQSFVDLALVLAVLTFGGALSFVRLLERRV
jgi:multisubunit Na+/H+ antiporter MnhF subunit